MKDECYVEYAHWRGIDAFHMNYTCPFYGAPKDAPCEICDGGRFWTTGINMSMDGAGETTDFVFEIINYPLTIPLHDLLTGRPCITISGKAKLTNHSAAFLELD